MLTNIKYLSEGQVKGLAQIIEKIVQAITPEKIICYGSRTKIVKGWGCFLVGKEYNEQISTFFDLLIIVSATEKRPDHDIVQLIEQACKELAEVACIVHKLQSVNDAIIGGSRFFTTLFNKGVLVYDSTGLPLATPPEESDFPTTMSKIKTHWEKDYGLAKHFYNVASFSLSSGWPELTVFLLHQAAEQTCIAMIRLYTGYRSNTHNLSRLFAMTENFSLSPRNVFPCITKEETDLFNLLVKSYTESRYKDGYSVSIDNAAILAGRVKELQAIAELLYQEKISPYFNNWCISFPLVLQDRKP